jgi:antitoxin (DNA-binding transcriptional repressor) of toxin-antitoxin stability system
LGRLTAEMLDEVQRTRRPMLVFRNGRPVAALVALDEDKLGDYILANAPPFVASLDEADEDARRGRLRPVSEVLAEVVATFDQRRAWESADGSPSLGDRVSSHGQPAAGFPEAPSDEPSKGANLG